VEEREPSSETFFAGGRWKRERLLAGGVREGGRNLALE
jgi:hypothetical protein